MMRKYVVECAELITSALMDKVMENPYEAEFLMEQALQQEDIVEAILKKVRGFDGASETQDLEVVAEEDILVEATVGAEASNSTYTTVPAEIGKKVGATDRFCKPIVIKLKPAKPATPPAPPSPASSLFAF
ncbi:hypothetical protein KIW84_072407 [Lathyrus oleraceus]|uniref:Uncharacterized protein n=1 Tax=Pisum sativum TaxID=3888 RepID=A0A9D4VL70_PEA|nr:hypothetical protein KIW84_072407 [Pisum sativum]